MSLVILSIPYAQILFPDSSISGTSYNFDDIVSSPLMADNCIDFPSNLSADALELVTNVMLAPKSQRVFKNWQYGESTNFHDRQQVYRFTEILGVNNGM